MTPCIQIKRVYEVADPADGFRILVDRLWPRGIRKDALPYDLWPKDLTPSPALRRWFHEDPDGRWARLFDPEDGLKRSQPKAFGLLKYIGLQNRPPKDAYVCLS